VNFRDWQAINDAQDLLVNARRAERRHPGG